MIGLLLENGAKTTIKTRVSGADVEIEALSYAKVQLNCMRPNIGKIGFLDTAEADLKRQEQLVALLERFELRSPSREAWMGAVYKGCVVRDRAAGTPVAKR